MCDTQARETITVAGEPPEELLVEHSIWEKVNFKVSARRAEFGGLASVFREARGPDVPEAAGLPEGRALRAAVKGPAVASPEPLSSGARPSSSELPCLCRSVCVRSSRLRRSPLTVRCVHAGTPSPHRATPGSHVSQRDIWATVARRPAGLTGGCFVCARCGMRCLRSAVDVRSVGRTSAPFPGEP